MTPLALRGDGAWHDAVLAPVGRLIRHGEQGHRGAVAALDTLHALFAAAIAADPNRQRDKGEWQRMVIGAIGKIMATRTAAGISDAAGHGKPHRRPNHTTGRG